MEWPLFPKKVTSLLANSRLDVFTPPKFTGERFEQKQTKVNS